MTASALGSRRFTLDDQLEFAEISGDWNPLHVDPIAARRTIYGDVVVHGIHVLLWALECLAQLSSEKRGLSNLNTKFKRQVHLGELISCKLLQLDTKGFKLSLEAKGKIVLRIDGSFCQTRYELGGLPKALSRTECRDLGFEDVTAASGSLALFVDEHRVRRMFPNALNLLTHGQIAELLATTRLVGMECPGRHSIYLGHNVHFHDERIHRGHDLSFEVMRSDSRFSMLWLNVTGPTLRGTVMAFARPRPQTQAAVETVRTLVTKDEFIKSCALIIGGSRGLGEITAKIIAAGGGEVWITYSQGRDDAERVTREIQSAGFKCRYFQFDATAPVEIVPAQFGRVWAPNQVYYFATPPVSLETGDWFSQEKFDIYCRFYVNAFSATVGSILRMSGNNLSIFYPSTIFLEQFQEHSSEYCAAKAAGELLCRHLERLFPPLRVYAPRLKRMTTDQTSGLLPTDAEDSLLGMLSAIRGMPASS
jgi:NAD(P)-dependent dehydrogenase (short-subunit alcohol dehydrogenase family)